MLGHLLVNLLLDLWPGGETVEVEEEGGGGGGEAVTEQGQADHRHVLQSQSWPGEKVGEEVEVLVRHPALLHRRVEGQHGLLTQRGRLRVKPVLGSHQPLPGGSVQFSQRFNVHKGRKELNCVIRGGKMIEPIPSILVWI